MSIKIDRCKHLPIHRRLGTSLFKNTQQTTYSAESNNSFMGATDMISGVHISKVSRLLFVMLDKLNPFLQKHSRISRFVISLDEKLIRFNENHSANKLFG